MEASGRRYWGFKIYYEMYDLSGILNKADPLLK
jgi:hypothetical protein